MENVTLTPKEQMRVQVLNSLLAEQIALDQAAEVMAVSAHATPAASLTAYRDRKEQPPWHTATVAANRSTQHPRR